MIAGPKPLSVFSPSGTHMIRRITIPITGIRPSKIIHPDLFRSCRRRTVTPQLGSMAANIQIPLSREPIFGMNPSKVLMMNKANIQSQNSACPARPLRHKYFLVKISLWKGKIGQIEKKEIGCQLSQKITLNMFSQVFLKIFSINFAKNKKIMSFFD